MQDLSPARACPAAGSCAAFVGRSRRGLHFLPTAFCCISGRVSLVSFLALARLVWRQGRRGSHTTAQELQTCTFQGTCASKHQFHEKTPRETQKQRNGGGKGRKSAKFWAPHPSGPHPFGAPLSLGLGPPPIGAPPFGAPFWVEPRWVKH